MISHEVLTMRWSRQLAAILVLSVISLMPQMVRAEEVLDPIATMVGPASGAFKQHTKVVSHGTKTAGVTKQHTQSLSHGDVPAGVTKQN